jgi:hypothetical protein
MLGGGDKKRNKHVPTSGEPPRVTASTCRQRHYVALKNWTHR